MHEGAKLKEAEYFLSRMQAVTGMAEAFRFELSAFLSAARSVLQYACAEATARPCGQAWYQAHMNRDPVLGFFKDRRDINIHRKPVEVSGTPHVEIADAIHIGDSLSISVFDKDGRLVEAQTVGSPVPKSGTPASEVGVTYSYSFADWPDPDDVLLLCEKYLASIADFVDDGVKKGFVSG